MQPAGGLYEDSFLKETWIIMGGTLLLSMIAALLGGAAPALAVAWIPAVYFLCVKAPLHIGVRALFVFGMFVEQPDMNSGSGYWQMSGSEPPLAAASQAVFGNLKNLVGIPVPFSIFAVAACVLTYRGVRAKRLENKMAGSRLALRLILFYGVAILGYEVFGILRGGKVQESVFQMLPLLMTPFIAAAFVLGIRGREDLYALGNIIVSTAIARGLLVFWVYFMVCRPMGIRPEYASTHGDSTTFAAALLVMVAHALELRKARAYWRIAVVGGFILVAMVLNNRRLAFASTAMALFGMYFTLPPSKVRKRVNKYLLTLGPIAAIYVFVGETIDHPVFAPARLALSAFNQKDDSSASRVIENENLLATLADAPFFGTGFGFEYKEVVKVYDISEFFPLYRFLPHNSVLWLITVGGVVGFVLFWLLYLGAAFLCARAFRLSETVIERASALAGIGIVITCVSQDWGDVGSHSFPKILIWSAALAVGARICAGAELRSKMLA
jgi:hypothetical protein